MGNMEEQNFDLLNMEQEDDNLLGISPSNAENCSLGVSPLSPSIMPKALKKAVTEDLENCHGKGEVAGVPAVVGAALDVSLAPVPCRSPWVPKTGPKVLSALNINDMNKRTVNRDIAEEFKSRKGFGIRESLQLDGIAETSPVQNPGTFTSQLSRSYLDIENEQSGVTPEKGGEPTVFRKSRTRRSTTLRKSLAWDKAFFTDEGVLDNEELFAVASDTPKTLAMPELATIWDGPQNLVSSFEGETAAAKTKLQSAMRPEVRSPLRTEERLEVRPEVRAAVDTKPQQDVSHASTLRPDALHTSSLRPVRQIQTTGSHAFSNAYSRAAAIPPGSTSIPLPNSLTRAGKQPGVVVQHPTELAHGTGQDMKESRNTTAGLHHQARIAALKKAHEAPPQKGPRVRLPNSKKVENKPSEEIPKMHASREKQPKKVQNKPSEDLLKTYATHGNQPTLTRSLSTHENQPTLTRSMSTPSLIESPSALSRKVSSMSKRVKETLGKVMAGRAQRVPKEPSLSHVHPIDKTSLLPKRTGVLPTVSEAKDPNHRARSNSAVPMKVNKEGYTVRDILRGKGPSSPKAASKQGPTLTRSRSACAAVPALPRATEPGPTRVIVPPAPSAPSVPSAPPAPVQPAEPIRKPTGLRKPSPKLGFFDAGRASSAPQKAFAISQPFNCMRNNQPVKPVIDSSIPVEALGRRSQGLPSAKTFSAIPTAPHLRHGVASAPTSPRSIQLMHPSSPEGNFTTSTRPSSPTIESVDPKNFSRIKYAEQFAESHQLLARKRSLGDVSAGSAPEASPLDSSKLSVSPPTSAAVNMKPADLVPGKFGRSFAESNSLIQPAANIGGSAHSGSSLETGGGDSDDNVLITSIPDATRSDDKSSALASQRHQNSRSEPEKDYALDDRHLLETSSSCTQDTDDEILEKIVSSGAWELDIASNDPKSSTLKQPNSVSSASGRRHNEMNKPTTFSSYSSISSSFREMYSAAVGSCEDASKTAMETEIPSSACPSTPTRKERSHLIGAKISKHLQSPRSKSFRENPVRPGSSSDSPVSASKHVRSFSQRVAWQSPGGKIIGDASPGVGPSTPASASRRHSFVSPSHAPDAAGTFEVLTPSSAKNAHCVRTPGSSSKKVIRKIVEFESPSTQWSNWPVLGAAISADELPGSSTKEGLSSTPARPVGEHATEQLTELRANSSANLLSTPTSTVRHTELNSASNEICTLATEQPTEFRLSFSSGFVTTPTKFAEIESGSVDRNSSVGLDGAEVCGSAKKERGSSMFSFARKAVARLTSSPASAEPSGLDNEGTPKAFRKISRRFSRSSIGNCSALDPKPLPLFSEARICELEAAGPEILQKKNGPVQNSPPDKVVSDSNPWSPVRKNGQPLGPFDCTKFKYISPGLIIP